MPQMDIEARLNLWLVYWAPLGTDRFGKQQLAAPVEKKCHWEDQVEEFIDVQGERRVSNAVVYTAEKLKPLGVVWEGRLADLASTDSPFENEGAFEIRKSGSVPSVDGTQRLYTAVL